MKPARILRASMINTNFIDQKELYSNHANLIKELLRRTEDLSSTIDQNQSEIADTNKSNKDTFIALQNEINKIKATTNEMSVIADTTKAKEAIESLSNTINELTLNTTNDVSSIREDISVLKRATNDLYTVKSTVNGFKGDVSSFQTNLLDVRSDMSLFKTETLNSLSAIENNLNQLRQSSVEALRKELLDIIENSIPKFNPSTSIEDVNSDDTDTNVRSVNDIDYPFDIPKDPNFDSFEVNGIYLTATSKNNQNICSITNSFGGIAIDKEDSFDRWIIERNDDKHLRFHFNKELDPPLTINHKGISTNELTIGDRRVRTITNTFTEDNINNHTIPTTKAIFDFVHANKLLKNINIDDQALTNQPSMTFTNDNSLQVNTNDQTDEESLSTISSTKHHHRHKSKQPVECNVSTCNLNGKHTLVVQNDSCSIALKDSDKLHTIKASDSDGLLVNNTFKLSNDEGILCYMSADKLPNDITDIQNVVGLFATCTGNIEPITSIDGEHVLYVPEIKVPTKVAAGVVGVITKIILPKQNYTKSNRIYDIRKHKFISTPTTSDDDEYVSNSPHENSVSNFSVVDDGQLYYFVTIAVKGIVKVNVNNKDTKLALGQIMIPADGGKAVPLFVNNGQTKKDKKERKSDDEKLIKCIQNGVPRVKVIAAHHEQGFFFGLLIF